MRRGCWPKQGSLTQPHPLSPLVRVTADEQIVEPITLAGKDIEVDCQLIGFEMSAGCSIRLTEIEPNFLIMTGSVLWVKVTLPWERQVACSWEGPAGVPGVGDSGG